MPYLHPCNPTDFCKVLGKFLNERCERWEKEICEHLQILLSFSWIPYNFSANATINHHSKAVTNKATIMLWRSRNLWLPWHSLPWGWSSQPPTGGGRGRAETPCSYPASASSWGTLQLPAAWDEGTLQQPSPRGRGTPELAGTTSQAPWLSRKISLTKT